MALVDDGTMTMAEREQPGEPSTAGPEPSPQKKVFLVAAFRTDGDGAGQSPVTGLAEDVVAVIGMAGDRQRFEWVGIDRADSIANPALVTPVKVRLALPSPWHPEDDGIVTGLVQLDGAKLGDGTVDEDVDHLLTELGKSRAPGPRRTGTG